MAKGRCRLVMFLLLALTLMVFVHMQPASEKLIFESRAYVDDEAFLACFLVVIAYSIGALLLIGTLIQNNRREDNKEMLRMKQSHESALTRQRGYFELLNSPMFVLFLVFFLAVVCYCIFRYSQMRRLNHWNRMMQEARLANQNGNAAFMNIVGMGLLMDMGVPAPQAAAALTNGGGDLPAIRPVIVPLTPDPEGESLVGGA
mmetsp:Transcript_150539/g.419495  ORF Transcript_150539/g.419495 Transcript_150539/m.419495 type:complete len:202 (+) Transcript_150539:91-696(+)